ncbi:unnamed protein product [Clavelina lepadiformis]|uniref:Transporter n=1 Tax=Clavelina lepadiformis TaxID=159417 RepID=A0ABP0F0W2_CLALP
MSAANMANVTVEHENNNKRQTWSKSSDFYMSSVGFSIGLGNIWRFPYMCFKWGGGAFLIPYLLSVILLAIPLLTLEVSLGQSVRKGVIASWAAIPLFKGIAYASGVTMFYVNVSYPVILAWVFKYFVSSFSSKLPWMSCDNEWNTEHCVSLWGLEKERISERMEKLGSIRKDLALYLALIWILGYFTIFKGIKLSAKIFYFTATVPIILMIIVTIRGATLEGASIGIYYYLNPDMTQLKNPEVWIAAATQVFYSLSIGTATLITLGSYNKYHHNFVRDVTLLAFSNSLASFLCGFAVFSTLGSMAFRQNLTMTEVTQSGSGLVFIAYPQALTFLPLPQFWNVVFFLTLLLLGFDTLCVFVESFCAFVMDVCPRLRDFHKYSREIFLVFCNAGFCLLGLICTTEGGVYVFEVINTYGVAGWSLFFIATCEFVAVGWVYGADRHWDEINRMVGSSRVRQLMVLIWKYFGPMICLAIFIYYVTAHSPLSYGSYVYPTWAQAICHVVASSSAACIPLYAVYIIFTKKTSWPQMRRREEIERADKDINNEEEYVEML